jgi:hypothetical protein
VGADDCRSVDPCGVDSRGVDAAEQEVPVVRGRSIPEQRV